MIRRILCTVLAALMILCTAPLVSAVLLYDVYILDETQQLSHDSIRYLNDEAKLWSEYLSVDILYVRTDRQDLEAYAGTLNMGTRHDQVMLIENSQTRKILFFGTTRVMPQSRAQWVLEEYANEKDPKLAVRDYLISVVSMIKQARSDGAFDQIPKEYLEKRPRLFDDGDLLKGKEEQALRQRLDEISRRQGMDVLLVITKEPYNEYERFNAKAYWQEHSFGKGEHDTAVMLLVYAGTGEGYLCTFGDCQGAFTEDGRNYIMKKISTKVKREKYVEAFGKYAELCDEFITQAKTGEPYDGKQMPKGLYRWKLYLAISLLAGACAGAVVVIWQKDRLRSARFHFDASDYLTDQGATVTEDRAIYLYKTTEKRERI